MAFSAVYSFTVKQLIGCVYNEHFYVSHAHGFEDRRSSMHDLSICMPVICLNFATTDGKQCNLLTSWVSILRRKKNTTVLSSYFKSNFYCVFFSFWLRYCCVYSTLLTYLFILLSFLFFSFDSIELRRFSDQSQLKIKIATTKHTDTMTERQN